jgi:hypothetical protein
MSAGQLVTTIKKVDTPSRHPNHDVVVFLVHFVLLFHWLPSLSSVVQGKESALIEV